MIELGYGICFLLRLQASPTDKMTSSGRRGHLFLLLHFRSMKAFPRSSAETSPHVPSKNSNTCRDLNQSLVRDMGTLRLTLTNQDLSLKVGMDSLILESSFQEAGRWGSGGYTKKLKKRKRRRKGKRFCKPPPVSVMKLNYSTACRSYHATIKIIIKNDGAAWSCLII